jgi:hypothetical protein
MRDSGLGYSRWNGLGTALLMVPLPLYVTAACLAVGAVSSPQQRRRRVWILFWTVAAFFFVPCVSGMVWGATLGYSITQGTSAILGTDFVICCSIAALVVGRVGYVLGMLGWLPGTQYGERAACPATIA